MDFTELKSTGFSYRELESILGVSHATVRNLVLGKVEASQLVSRAITPAAMRLLALVDSKKLPLPEVDRETRKRYVAKVAAHVNK